MQEVVRTGCYTLPNLQGAHAVGATNVVRGYRHAAPTVGDGLPAQAGSTSKFGQVVDGEFNDLIAEALGGLVGMRKLVT